MSVSETGLNADTVREWRERAQEWDWREASRTARNRIVALAEEWERQAATIAKLETALGVPGSEHTRAHDVDAMIDKLCRRNDWPPGISIVATGLDPITWAAEVDGRYAGRTLAEALRAALAGRGGNAE